MVKLIIHKEFPISGWRLIIYVLGFIFGMLNLFFWFYQLCLYGLNNYGEKFFGVDFHKRTYYFGWFVFIILIFISISLILILLF